MSAVSRVVHAKMPGGTDGGGPSLSSTKRQFIESWRQDVSAFMESGNICRTTIAELTPEPLSHHEPPLMPVFLKNVPGDSNTNAMDKLRLEDLGSPVLPAVKFSYCHADDDITKQERRQKSSSTKHREKRTSVIPAVLPPSPNGVIVQNGVDRTYQKSRHALKAVENKMNGVYAEPEVYSRASAKHDSNGGGRKSTKTAREIYEKYNMKSKTHNMLMNNSTEHSSYSMPWRNKTFLSLPLRFNGNIPRKQQQRHTGSASRHVGMYGEDVFDDFSDTDDVRFTRQWTDVGF